MASISRLNFRRPIDADPVNGEWTGIANQNASVHALNDDGGSPLGWNYEILTAFSARNGATWYTGSLQPAETMDAYFSLTTSATATSKFTGLDNAKTYNVSAFGYSNLSGQTLECEVTCAGAAQTLIVNKSGIEGQQIDFSGVSPTAGEISLDFEDLPGSSSSILGGLIIEEAVPAASTASRNVTNVAAGAVQTFQVMEAGVNTTAGEGLGGSDLVVIEDNHQVTVPLVVSGVTITIGADTLNYQLDQTEMGLAGNSITFDAVYYSPSTQQSSKIAVTVTATASVVSGSMTDWIEANGAGGQVNDAWITYMKGAGASGKTFNDLMFSWLGGLGYTGSLSDRVAAWSKVNLN
tara:strand:- start:54 stop:1106 length:1053 start_codon:yes stop_codon:yes gene_type:complete